MMRLNFGNLKEVLELRDKYGMEYLMEMQYILSIINQEDELDAR
jgi:hypothetical protein